MWIPGTGVETLQNLQKLRVRAWKSYRTHRSSGYGYGRISELTEVPGRYTNECCTCALGIVTGVQNLLQTPEKYMRFFIHAQARHIWLSPAKTAE